MYLFSSWVYNDTKKTSVPLYGKNIVERNMYKFYKWTFGDNQSII